MTRNIVLTTALVLAAALPASAEQFVVQVDSPYDGASERLQETLKVSEVEAFSENGAHYVILEAPNEAYVEAFFLAIQPKAIELNVLEADWTRPAMAELSMSQRLGFLKPIDCDFCAG